MERTNLLIDRPFFPLANTRREMQFKNRVDKSATIIDDRRYFALLFENRH